MPSACRNQRKRTGTTVTERKPAESYRIRENAGGTWSCASCLRFVIHCESARILVCTHGVGGPSRGTLYGQNDSQLELSGEYGCALNAMQKEGGGEDGCPVRQLGLPVRL